MLRDPSMRALRAACRKAARRTRALQAAEKLPWAVGRGFIPGITPVESAWASQAAEKGLRWRDFRYRLLQGLKPDVDLIGFIGMTEVMPCYKALEICALVSFSAACSAPEVCLSDLSDKITPFSAACLASERRLSGNQRWLNPVFLIPDSSPLTPNPCL
jgi:hypothetical protein